MLVALLVIVGCAHSSSTPTTLELFVNYTSVGELRRAVDAMRRLARLPSILWNYSAPTSFVRAAHFVEIRNALEQARTMLSQMAAVSMPNLGDPVVAGAPIRALDLQRLMDGTK